MSDTWYMVMNPYPEGGKPTKRHDTFESARDEAIRVSGQTKRKIHVLKLVGSAIPPSDVVAWRDR